MPVFPPLKTLRGRPVTRVELSMFSTQRNPLIHLWPLQYRIFSLTCGLYYLAENGESGVNEVTKIAEVVLACQAGLLLHVVS